jgi:hypothetical protein
MLQRIAPEISFGWRSGMPLWQWHGDGRLAREVSHKITWGDSRERRAERLPPGALVRRQESTYRPTHGLES